METSHTALVYYMIEGDPAGSITSADRTAGLMQLFSEQELAIKFGYEVVVKAEGVILVRNLKNMHFCCLLLLYCGTLFFKTIKNKQCRGRDHIQMIE